MPVESPTGASSGTESRPGGWCRRAAATFVDLAVVLTLTMLLLAFAIDVDPPAFIHGRTATDARHLDPFLYDAAYLRFIFVVAAFDIGFAYQLIASALGGTPGLRAAGLRLERAETGGRPGLGRAVDRVAGGWLSILTFGLGFVLAVRDPLGRGLPERMSGLVIVRSR